MSRRHAKPKLVDLVKLVLENRDSEAEALAYETLYGKVSDLYRRKPSRRDFQAALDYLENSDGLVIEKDPSDRRRVRIWRAGSPATSNSTGAIYIDLADFLREHAEYSPLYVTPSGAMRIRGVEEKDVSRELTRMFRYTTPLVKAFKEIFECEKLGKKPDESAVRKWSEQYERVVDAIAEATAIEFSGALKAKRKIDTKKIVDSVEQTLSRQNWPGKTQ